MSAILGGATGTGVQFGAAAGGEDMRLSDREFKLFQKIFAPENLLLIQTEFLTWLKDRLVIDGFEMPISQVLGFSAFQPQLATRIATSQTTTSTSYTDLATAGPTLTGLPDGRYWVVYSAFSRNSADGNLSVFSLSVNGAAPEDADQGGQEGTQGAYTLGWSDVELNTGGNNTLKVQYRVNGGTGTFLNRRLMAVKYANV